MIETEQHPVLGGRYMLLELLGAGRAVEVYRARDRLLDREVALKLLREEHASDPGCVERFREEARSAASLSHPNIVQIYELGVSDEGHPFVAMEYVGGGTLKDRLRGSGALYPAEAAGVASRVARALQAAHSRGVIHCDIRPQNVLLTGSGTVKVADFGVARAADARSETARYTSPEQAAGEAAGPASDLYSLGAVLYEMLTGEPPFSATKGPPRPPERLNPDVPEALSALTLRLLARVPSERPPDAAAVLRELDDAIEAASVQRPRPESGPSRIYRAGSRLFPVLVERKRGSPSSASRGRQRPGPPVDAATGARRRKKRGRSLAVVSLAVLLAAAGWGLYGGELQTLYEDVPRQTAPDESTPDSSVSATPSGQDTTPDRMLVHTAGGENVSDNSTYLDLPEANGRPDAFISVTQNWNPESETGTYNEHPVGVWYDADRERWAIFNQDRAEMPEGASFNVVVWSDPARGA